VLLTRLFFLLIAVADPEGKEEGAGDTVVALQATALTVVSVIASAANTLVAIVFYRRPALRSPSNRSDLFLKLTVVKLKH
jgi:hypothetical protein